VTGAVSRSVHAVRAEALDPFADRLYGRIELTRRCGLAHTTIHYGAFLSTFRRQPSILMVDAADFLQALNSPPGNRLEALKGDLAGKHSIRINDQWRIVFRWTDAGPEDVEIIDYH
jgi:plasmid maintenance system killer protein